MLRRGTPNVIVHINDEDKRRRRHPLTIIWVSLIALAAITFLVILSSNPSTIRTSDVIIYDNETAPWKDEVVVDYRPRLRRQLGHIVVGTIFVSVASYRDDDCPATLANLFQMAADPDRITIGLVDQVDDGDDDIACDALLTPTQRRHVRVVRVPRRQARGPTYARYLASKLWEREQFFMQIDAHSRFAPAWDGILVDNLAALPDRFVITHYPPGDPSELTPSALVTWICSAQEHEQAPLGLFVQAQDYCRPVNQSPDLPQGTCTSPFMGGGLLFANAQILEAAPFDRHLDYLFHGEEVLIGARLWTSGYTMVTPRRNVISHTYGGRPKNVFADGIDQAEARRSEARVRLLLDVLVDEDGAGDNINHEEIVELGMGGERDVADYRRFAGLEGIKERRFESRCGQRFQEGVWVNVTTTT